MGVFARWCDRDTLEQVLPTLYRQHSWGQAKLGITLECWRTPSGELKPVYRIDVPFGAGTTGIFLERLDVPDYGWSLD